MTEKKLDTETINALAELAANPHAGQVFTFGGKRFTRQFMTIDQQAALTALTVSLIKDARGATLEVALADSIPMLKKALGIILIDQDAECTDTWINNARGKDCSINNMVGIVMGQMLINEMGDLLGKILAIAAIAGSLAKK